jgi:aryl-alcohol dehydrogenase-like predicted oxidoreductase
LARTGAGPPTNAPADRSSIAFSDAGGIFTDTANNYTDGTSQTWLGEVMASRRERFVIGTKYGLSASPHDPNAVGNHRKNLIQSLDASLRRLGTAYVDI